MINSEKASTSHKFDEYIGRFSCFRFSMIHIHDPGIKINLRAKMTEILEQLKKSIHNTTEAGINDFSGGFLIYENQETHHSVALDKCISKFDLMINNVVFAIELQGVSLPIEEIPDAGDSEEFDAQIEHLERLNNSIKVLSESRTYLEILRAEMVQETGRQACKHIKIGTEL